MQKKLLPLAIVLLTCCIPTLYAAPITLSSSLYVSEEYTDNLNLDPENEEDSYITTAGLNLNGQALWKTGSLNLYYNPSYSKYDEDTEYDSWRHSAGISLSQTFKRYTTLDIGNTYLRTNEPWDESDRTDLAGPIQDPAITADNLRRGRREYYTNVSTARLSHQFGEDDSLYAGYRYYISEDVDQAEDDTEDNNNNGTFTAGLVYNYDFSPKWGTSLTASYDNSIYEEQDDRQEYNGQIRLLYRLAQHFSTYVAYSHTILTYDQDSESEDYQIYQPSIGLNYQFQENAGVDVAVAYTIRDYEDREDKEGYNINSNIYKRWNYRTGYFGIAGRSGYSIDDNNREDNGLNIYYEGRIDAGYNFTSRFSSSVYGSYRNDEYPNQTPDRVDNTIRAGAGLHWQALRWLSFSLSYDYSNVISDNESLEYTENSYMLRATLTPLRPLRWN